MHEGLTKGKKRFIIVQVIILMIIAIISMFGSFDFWQRLVQMSMPG